MLGEKLFIIMAICNFRSCSSHVIYYNGNLSFLIMFFTKQSRFRSLSRAHDQTDGMKLGSIFIYGELILCDEMGR